MPELNDHMIEVWARNPDSLTAEVRKEVERRIARYPDWREAAEYWKEYYGILADLAPGRGEKAEPRNTESGE